MAFTTGGKRSEDVSLRLKAQDFLNLHKTREQTRQMALETRKMEERLEELKVAMSREKEEREKQGGGFWKTGQTGTLGNYGKEATEKRSKPTERRDKSTKARKYKVLKDEPVVTPQRSKQPGTVGHIAQREAVPKDKTKGPKCGQCETRPAQVTCLECGEDYCAADFASFHLKGALKRHRSIPVRVNGANARQNYISPRPPVQKSNMGSQIAPANGYSATSPVGGATENPMKVTLTDIDITDLMPSKDGEDYDTQRSSPVGASHNFDGPSLLDGQYDEGDSAASFQAALKAWRTGDSEDTAGVATSGRSRPAVRPVSPVKSPIVQTDHGTSTMENADLQPLEITFKNDTMSYADKLLLKKHRRTDLDPLPQDDHLPSIPQRTQPMRQSRQQYYSDPDDDEEGYDDDEEGVDFESLYSAVVPQSKQLSRPQSDVSIIELTELPSSMKGLEQSSSYKVTEEPDNFTPSKPRLTKSGRKKKGTGIARHAFGSPTDSTSKPGTPATRTSKSRSSQRISMDNDKENVKASNSVASRLGSRTPVSTRLAQAGTDLEKNTKSFQSERDENDSRDMGASSRADSRTESRARSRMNRPTSSMAERRKVDKSKRQAAKESVMDGNLTKAPSEGLKEVLRRASSIEPVEYQGGLGDFFTVGVKPVQEDRVLTPSSKKNQKDEKWKVSYKLYQMAPRSWRPDSSLGDTIPLDEVSVVNSGLVQSGEEETQTISWSWSSHNTPTPDSNPQHKLPPLDLSSRPPTAGKSSRRSKTPTTASRRSVTPRIPSTLGHSPRPPTASGRESRAIVMDGQDLSCHDNDDDEKYQEEEDDETLDQLEWELASQSGRITADGKISRMSMMSPELSDDDGVTDTELRRSYSKGLQNQGFDINSRLRESELMVDFEEMEQQMIEDEVKALR